MCFNPYHLSRTLGTSKNASQIAERHFWSKKVPQNCPTFQTYKKSPAGHCPTREWNFIDKLRSLLWQRYGKNVVNLHKGIGRKSVFPNFFSCFCPIFCLSNLTLMNYENLYRQWSWSDDRRKTKSRWAVS